MTSGPAAPSHRAGDVGPALLVTLGYAAACALALALGFDHVSDDDYARVTIAQAFAHAPRLDPSGTSWLPFPFWITGTIMALLGRSLAVARGANIALASAAALLPYFALRQAGSSVRSALLGLGLAFLSPWSVWLGAATVPESFTASATAAAAVALGIRTISPRARLALAVALFAACLSRYEPWPVAALLAIVVAARAWKARDPATLLAALVAAAGPLAWMAWNLHAHGDALHFFARVSRFKRAIGEGSTDPLAAVLLYPRLLVTTRPDVLVALVAALVAARRVLRRADFRRWRLPLACAGAQVVFLAYGNARDGAPAHHAERALLGPILVLAFFAADLLAIALTRARARGLRASAVALVATALTTVRALGAVPGRGPAEDRASAIALGNALRDEGVAHLVVTPCAYEHFALVAAYQAPEAVTTNPRASMPTCPAVERR